MMRIHGLALPILLGLAAAAGAESVLVLPVPGATDTPRERVNLSIVIPNKSTPVPEPPQRERIKSSAISQVDWSPFKTIPQKRFVFDTLKIFRKKGLVERVFDKDTIDREIDLWATTGQTVTRVYTKLLDIYRRDALKKFGITVSDVERLQRVVDIFSRYFEMYNCPVVEVNKRLDEMVEVLKKTTGRGQIRITSVRENKDGSTLLEMEILRPPAYDR
ncbi:MAG: hypothetical protein HY815_27540 [Candidatus Riflebacteria bacterium]|nr:hypothetical protein [Candidatus Riflebacteria bacterium]